MGAGGRGSRTEDKGRGPRVEERKHPKISEKYNEQKMFTQEICS